MADLNVNGKLVAPRIVLDTQDGNYNEGVRINAKDDAWAVTIYGTPLDTDINGNYDNSMIVGRPANDSDLIISGTKNNLDDTKRVRITQTGELYEKGQRVYSPNNIPDRMQVYGGNEANIYYNNGSSSVRLNYRGSNVEVTEIRVNSGLGNGGLTTLVAKDYKLEDGSSLKQLKEDYVTKAMFQLSGDTLTITL